VFDDVRERLGNFFAVAIATMCAGLLAHVVFVATSERIATHERSKAAARLRAAIGEAAASLGDSAIAALRAGRRVPACDEGGAFLHSLTWVQTEGYGGPLEVLVVTDHAGGVIDRRPIAHRETPGFIDATTGATVTAKALADAVRRARLAMPPHGADNCRDADP